MYVETTKEGEVQADVSAEDVVAVEAVAEPVEVAGDESVEAVTFEAEHFSIYTVTFWTTKLKIHVMDANTQKRSDLKTVDSTNGQMMGSYIR